MMNKFANTHKIYLLFILTQSFLLSILFANDLAAKNITSNNIIDIVSHENMKNVYDKGVKYMNENRLDSALLYLTIVAKTAEQGKTKADSIIAMMAYNRCGSIHFFSKNYQGAYSNYKRAIKSGGEENAYWIYGNIAMILNMYGAYDDSEKLFINTYKRTLEKSDWNHLINVYSNILNQCYLNNHLDSISDILTGFHSLPIPPSIDVHFLEKITNGMISAKDADYNEAIKYFKQGYELADSTFFPDRARIDCATYVAKSFRDAGKPDSALVYLNNALSLANGEDMGDHLVNLYELISDCYAEMNNPVKAKEYLIRHYSLKDSISSIDDFSSIKNLDLNYEVDNYENKIMQVNKEKEQSRRYLFIISITLLVFLGLLIIVIVQNRKLKTSNKFLFEKNLEILKAADADRTNYLETKREKEEQKISESSSHDLGGDGNMKDDILTAPDDPKQQSARLNIPEEEQMRIKDAVEKFFYSSEEWKSPDFSLPRLCEIIGSNKQYVSQVINDLIGTNFPSLLNSHRINEACRRLLDVKNYGGLTIEAIAESLGYKSRSNFSKNFKKHTGLNPKEYVILAQSKQETSDQLN